MKEIKCMVTVVAFLGLFTAAVSVRADENCCPLLERCLLRPGCMSALTFETAEWVAEHYLEDC